MSSDAATMRNEIFALVRAAVQAYDPTVKILYEGRDKNRPTTDDTWLTLSIRHVSGNQSGFSATPTKKWNRTGLVVAQCFAPLASGSVKKATELACVVRDALQGKQTDSCVWFRSPMINEIGVDEGWFNVNANITFDYDELR